MADDVDFAQSLQERVLAKTLLNYSKTPEIPFSGFCLFCEEPIEKNRRYCDSDCREDHEKARR